MTDRPVAPADISEDRAQQDRAHGDIAAERACMRCAALFQSEGFGQRICPRCKGSQAWRSSVADGGGQGKRRTAARSG